MCVYVCVCMHVCVCAVVTFVTHNTFPQVLVAPDPAYWYRRNPLADEIFITAVTANLITVTIRECKKRQGFFKDNTDENQNSQSSIK